MRENDSGAFAAFFNANADDVYRLALGLLQDPSEAEDVLQDTFVALISHLDSFEGRSRLPPQLGRVGPDT
jgi:DNA-directed RNA polymerase specialized sigma24 family protein